MLSSHGHDLMMDWLECERLIAYSWGVIGSNTLRSFGNESVIFVKLNYRFPPDWRQWPEYQQLCKVSDQLISRWSDELLGVTFVCNFIVYIFCRCMYLQSKLWEGFIIVAWSLQITYPIHTTKPTLKFGRRWHRFKSMHLYINVLHSVLT